MPGELWTLCELNVQYCTTRYSTYLQFSFVSDDFVFLFLSLVLSPLTFAYFRSNSLTWSLECRQQSQFLLSSSFADVDHIFKRISYRWRRHRQWPLLATAKIMTTEKTQNKIQSIYSTICTFCTLSTQLKTIAWKMWQNIFESKKKKKQPQKIEISQENIDWNWTRWNRSGDCDLEWNFSNICFSFAHEILCRSNCLLNFSSFSQKWQRVEEGKGPMTKWRQFNWSQYQYVRTTRKTDRLDRKAVKRFVVLSMSNLQSTCTLNDQVSDTKCWHVLCNSKLFISCTLKCAKKYIRKK